MKTDKSDSIRIFLSALLIPISLVACRDLPAAQLSKPDEKATIVAPGGLSSRERSQLRRDYEYQVRDKDIIAGVSDSASSAAKDSAPVFEAGRQTEGEKLHRYFGIAAELYKQGRLEESAEILRYLNGIDPSDEYVKAYLGRVQRDMKRHKSRWDTDAAREAASLKRQKISSLLEYGKEYYNSEDYDGALTKFYDVLALDPGNSTAAAYLKKIKERYAKKIRVEHIVQNWDADKEAATRPAGLVDSADRLLDKKAEAARGLGDKAVTDAELKNIAVNRRAEDLLGEAEFGASVDAIISARRAEESQQTQLTLGPGDELNIAVLNHEELSGAVTVDPQGGIVLPLMGDPVMARGLTAGQLSKRIAKLLDKYVENPYVTVSVIKYRSQVFYVVDEISCTPYPITRSNLTLRDALFISDWGNNRALGRVIVMKPSKTHPVIKKVDAFDMIYRGNLSGNIPIAKGDVIYIPMTVAAKVTKAIYDTVSPFRALRVARDEYTNLKWNDQDWKSIFRMPDLYDNTGTGMPYESGSITNNQNNNWSDAVIFSQLERSYAQP